MFSSAAAPAARLYGASFTDNLVLAWFGRNAEDSLARRAIILDLFVYDTVGFLASLIIQRTGGMNDLGWSIVAIYLFFTIGFGYFLLPHKQAA